jgi:hypothetical protein
MLRDVVDDDDRSGAVAPTLTTTASDSEDGAPPSTSPERPRAAPVVRPPREQVDERIAHFRLIERLGRGGMGIVYRARDEKLGRDVALKVLPSNVVGRADRRERFLREARAAAAVFHPAIAIVYEIDTDGVTPYIAMELVAGRTLRAVLEGGPLALDALLAISIPIADALARAHRAGVVHRDLKPENVMLDAQGAPKILDFGIARVFDSAAVTEASGPDTVAPPVASLEGQIIGTPAYMSPEQARGHAVDRRSDLFSFGTILFELSCGQPPFIGTSSMDLLTAIIRDPAPPLPRDVPDELARIIHKLLEKAPDDRYQDAGDLAADLRRLQQAGLGTPPRAAARSPRRRVAPRAIGAVGAIAAAAIGGWLVLRGGASTTTRPPDEPARPQAQHMVERPLVPATREDLAGALSADGARLALVRDGRLTVQELASGSARTLALPGAAPVWLDWFPDGKQLLLGVPVGPDDVELFALPTDGTAARALGIHAWGAAVSPDGTRIASFDEGGLRLSALDGSHMRRLVGTRENAEFSWPVWSPDGRWITYGVRGTGIVPAIRAVSTDGSTDVALVEDPALATSTALLAYIWLTDGRLLFRTVAAGSSIVEILDVDLATARPRGPAVTLGTLPDVVGLESATRDGRHVLLSRGAVVTTEYRARLDQHELDLEPDEHPGWRAFGRVPERDETLVVAPGGTDHTELLAVGANGQPRTLASLSGSIMSPQITPDGGAVLFLAVEGDHVVLRRLDLDVASRAPVAVETLPYAPSSPPEFTEWLVAQLGCPRQKGRSCVLGATEGADQVFYEIDPAKGRGRRLGALHGAAPWTWSLSADGAEIIAAHRDKDVRILDVASGDSRQVIATPGLVVFSVAWIGASRAFLLAGGQTRTGEIVRVEPSGAMRTVWSRPSETPGRLRVLDEAGSELLVTTTGGTTSLGVIELSP